jgi:hypothetical protein
LRDQSIGREGNIKIDLKEICCGDSNWKLITTWWCELKIDNSIQFILCSSDPKGGYDPQDIEHVNSITPSVYIIICTKQTIK